MKINIFFNLTSCELSLTSIRTRIRRVLELEGRREVELNLVLVDDGYIQRLNRQFRGEDRPTDVLAFPGDNRFLGEVYISWDRALAQAKEFGVSIAEEVDRLAIHGLLHLLGYTHPGIYELEERYLKEVELME